MGLFTIPFGDKTSYGHTGGIDGFTSVFSYFPKEKCGFSWTSNGANYETNDISLTMLKAMFNKPYDLPKFNTYEVSSADLDKYLGSYSGANFPLIISITKKDKTLIAQATGQPSFGLEVTEKNKFQFVPSGIVLEFDPGKNEMILKQGGSTFVLVKEK